MRASAPAQKTPIPACAKSILVRRAGFPDSAANSVPAFVPRRRRVQNRTPRIVFLLATHPAGTTASASATSAYSTVKTAVTGTPGASEDSPDPAPPAIPMILPSGISTSMFFRLWTFAPRSSILSFMLPLPQTLQFWHIFTVCSHWNKTFSAPLRNPHLTARQGCFRPWKWSRPATVGTCRCFAARFSPRAPARRSTEPPCARQSRS